ncbi:MAG: phage tail sheath subtilisin-like domain-containing protein [Acidobacteria bacterium]|nr:phage tail sheath subtilisin-like domain-containing protein [Acidobacteriota bacterium]
MAYNIGVNVVEVDGAGAPAIVGAAVSVGAFNIQTKRGVPNRPTRVTTFTQFVEQFGGFTASSLGAYLVKGFFDNGGQTAYVNRAVATDPLTGASPSMLTLSDGAARATLLLETGFRGSIDPGAWGGELAVRVTPSSTASTRIRETAPATIQGTAPLAATTDMSAAPPLSLNIDGETTPTVINFQASDFANPALATRAEIRDAINRRTTKLIASLAVDNRLVLTSAGAVARIRQGWSSLQTTAANAPLNLTGPAAAPTLGTAAARTTLSTQVANSDVFQVGDVVRVRDATHTALVKIQRITDATDAVEWTPAVGDIADFDPFTTTIENIQFDLTVAYGGTEQANIVETWTGLSMESDLPNYAPRRLNDTLSGSRYLVATDRFSASAPGADVPAALAFTRFTPGREGTATANDFIGQQAGHTGFYAFDPADIQLLCCERTDAAIVTAALGYCAGRGDCMFVGAVPQLSVGAGQAVAYGQAFQGKKVYGALYGPWIKVFDPVGTGANPVKYVPPVGHVMGVYARVETARGIWKAPAGDEANIAGALDVEHQLSDADHTDLVKNGSVNGIRVVPGSGIIVDASRTLSTDTRWLYVNVRLLFNYVKSSLRRGLRWVRQEPNRDTLWSVVKYNSVTPFLMELWRQGAFGAGKPEEVFTVICDASNNPPEQVDQGNFKVEVYFYPSKPAETIIIIVGQQQSGASTAEG